MKSKRGRLKFFKVYKISKTGEKKKDEESERRRQEGVLYSNYHTGDTHSMRGCHRIGSCLCTKVASVTVCQGEVQFAAMYVESLLPGIDIGIPMTITEQ